jgi:PTS system N-acetylglucosamine-specific IIB component
MTKAELILGALGGDGNVATVEPCLSRVRVEVRDTRLVDDAALQAAGALGIVRAGRSVQVIVGVGAGALADDLDGLL